jgi:hypothetical protein
MGGNSSRWLGAYGSELKTAVLELPVVQTVGFAERIARMKRREVPRECPQGPSGI